MPDNIVESVLSNFNIGKISTFSVFPINCGLSSSSVHKVTSSEGVFVLKSYHKSTLNSLQSVHELLEKVRDNGFDLFPLIIPGKLKESFLYQHGFYWDLSSWIPGSSPDISIGSLVQCINKLFQFHSASDFHESEYGTMPAMEKRIREINSFAISPINYSSISFIPIPILMEHLGWIRQQLICLDLWPLPKVNIQFCWGDARKENILFNQDKISGFIDYCTMRKDCREVDVSRMISSFAGDDYAMWTDGLNAYSTKSPINYLVCRKLDILGTIGSFYRWLNLLQKPMPELILNQGVQRFAEIFQRIKKWKEHGSLKSMLFYD